MRPNLLDPDLYARDPYPIYRWLREEAPAYWDEHNRLWGISRWSDVMAVESNPGRYSSANGTRPHAEMVTTMINRDGPDHQGQRNLIARRFTPRGVRSQRDRVQEIVTDLVAAIAPTGQAEVVGQLAAPLPAMVISELLGFDRSLWPECMRWSEIVMKGLGREPYEMMSPDTPTSVCMAEFINATAQLLEERRGEPRDDLMSAWAHGTVDGEPLNELEIMAEALLLLTGGADTTRAVIGQTVLALITHPEERDKLLADPSLLERGAVEEFIRWVTPVVSMRRTVTEDHELHGELLHKGDEVLLLYGAANRDEAVFDDPDRFDVTRSPNNQVAFGFGTHVCLGAPLARLEIRVMFEELLSQLPDFRLAPGAVPELVPSFFVPSLKELPIEFTPKH